MLKESAQPTHIATSQTKHRDLLDDVTLVFLKQRADFDYRAVRQRPMTDSFAGFTKDEWIRAYRRVMSASQAEKEVSEFFAHLDQEPSNGFSLSSDTLALLSLVDDQSAEKVKRILAPFPESFRDEVAALITWYLDSAMGTAEDA